ncbi:hypothetical protein O6H91_04G040700 [Diphasiastrum complanatum]|uniref:Uncharacterized protein n=1 Tax=Diphasiastrum complanatum TaxID=34168 RepID=A0ACC2DW30_DIPCM|nr:hypothetical protein O6H91_04G040700 [Diphasiastrum complanatum]
MLKVSRTYISLLYLTKAKTSQRAKGGSLSSYYMRHSASNQHRNTITRTTISLSLLSTYLLSYRKSRSLCMPRSGCMGLPCWTNTLCFECFGQLMLTMVATCGDLGCVLGLESPTLEVYKERSHFTIHSIYLGGGWGALVHNQDVS